MFVNFFKILNNIKDVGKLKHWCLWVFDWWLMSFLLF